MLLDFISTVSAGFGMAGVVLIVGLILRRLAGITLPRWAVPASVGLAMLAFAVWNEYSWFARVTAQMSPQAVVVVAPAERAWYRPWTYARPITLRFIAVDLGGMLRSSNDPALRVVPVAVVQRWTATQRITVAVDCAAGRRADLIDGAELGPEGTLSNVEWRDVGPDDPIVAATCAEG